MYIYIYTYIQSYTLVYIYTDISTHINFMFILSPLLTSAERTLLCSATGENTRHRRHTVAGKNSLGMPRAL